MPTGSRAYAAMLCLVLALIIRAVVPAGWMLAQDAAGETRLIPCPSAGTVPQQVTSHHGKHDGDRHQDHERAAGSTCPFAVLLAPPLPGHPPILPPRLASVSAEPLSFLPPSIAPPGPASPPPPPTGPPVRA